MSADEESPVYLDHNATTPLLPEVVDAMLPFLRAHFGNPSSAHVYGRRARAAVEQARAEVAALIGAECDEIVFTSGGTEANNLAIRGAAEALDEARGGAARGRIVTSVIEHPATSRPVARLGARGWPVHAVGVDARGVVRIEEAREALGEGGVALVTLMHSNNETGAMQPVSKIAAMAKARGAVVHTDAAQSIGKVRVRVDELGVDVLSIAGHKVYAPKGVGALYVRRGTRIAPVVLGAGHERGVRPGTENVASIVGLGAACAVVAGDHEVEAARVRALRDALESGLRAGVPGLAVNGGGEETLPNTLSVRFPRSSGNALLAAAPEVAASTGSACHDGDERPSAVVRAMGVPEAEALGTVRLTLGRSSTAAEVARAVAALVAAWRSVARP